MLGCIGLATSCPYDVNSAFIGVAKKKYTLTASDGIFQCVNAVAVNGLSETDTECRQ